MDLSNPATCDNSAALTALTQGGFVMMMVFIVFSHKQGNNSPPLHHPRHIHHRSTPLFQGAAFSYAFTAAFPTVHPQATGQCGQLTEVRIQWQQPSCMNHGTFIHTPASRQRFWTPAPRCKRLSLAR